MEYANNRNPIPQPQLGLGEAVKLASGRLADFSGRSRRSEFWWWMLLVLLANFLIGLVLPVNLMLSAIVSTIIMACGLSVTARRLQDVGQSAIWVHISFAIGIVSHFYTAFALKGFYQELFMLLEDGGQISPNDMTDIIETYTGPLMTNMLLMLLWFISCLIVFVFTLMDSQPYTNKYGDSPKYVER